MRPKLPLANFFLVTALIITPKAAAASDDFNSHRKQFAVIEDRYDSGYCTEIAENEIYSDSYHRFSTLIAWDDLLSYAMGKKSITGELIGTNNFAMAGRTVNKAFFSFTNYARREDVTALIQNDLADIKTELEKITSAAKEDTSMEPFRKKYDEIKKQGLKPLATLTEQEVNRRLNELAGSPLLCIIYQVTTREGSPAAAEFQQYIDSVTTRAMHRNIRKFENAIRDLEQY